MLIPCAHPLPDGVLRLGGDPSACHVHMSYSVPVSFAYPTGTLYANTIARTDLGPMDLTLEQYILYAPGALGGGSITPVLVTVSAFLSIALDTTTLALVLAMIDGRQQILPPPPIPFQLVPDGTTITADDHGVISAVGGGGVGGFQWVLKTADYTVTGTDTGILVDATGGDVTITLPTAVGYDHEVAIKRVDATSHVVTLAFTGGETVDTFSSAQLVVAGHSYVLGSDDANWWISSGFFPNPMTTLGDLVVGDTAAIPRRLGVGADATALTADSTKPLGEEWE